MMAKFLRRLISISGALNSFVAVVVVSVSDEKMEVVVVVVVL